MPQNIKKLAIIVLVTQTISLRSFPQYPLLKTPYRLISSSPKLEKRAESDVSSNSSSEPYIHPTLNDAVEALVWMSSNLDGNFLPIVDQGLGGNDGKYGTTENEGYGEDD